MPVSPGVSRAFDQCFDAALGLAPWDAALQGLAEALGAESSVLMPTGQDFSARVRRQVESTEHAEFSALWLAHLADPLDDPHSIRARQISTARHPCVIEHQVTTEEERARLPYFNDVARRGRREWWALLRAESERRSWALNLYRGGRAGPYSPAEARQVAAAAPHLRRLAAAVEQVAHGACDARLDFLDRLRIAAFLVDREGLVLRANRNGDALLGRGLRLVRRWLAVEGGLKEEAFARFLRAVRADPATALPVVVAGQDGARWLVEAIPIGDRACEVFAGAHAILTVSDLLGKGGIAGGLLQDAFGLTPAEERLAQSLSDGQGLAAAALDLGIAHETARSHLHAVFDKTGTRSQAQLAALLTRLGERLRG